MSDQQEEQVEDCGLDIQELELNLGMFEIELDEKFKEIKQSFSADPSFMLDLTKLYYDHVNITESKFKELMLDLQLYLIKEELAATPTLRNTFFRVLENPLFSLFKTPKFELLDLSFKGFDVELEPIEAVRDVFNRLTKNVKKYSQLRLKHKEAGVVVAESSSEKQFRSSEQLEMFSVRKDIEYKIFMLYNYVRKGMQLLKKNYETRLAVCDMFAVLEKELLPHFVEEKHVRGVKELSTLNFEIYNLEPSYDYFVFFFSVPLQKQFKEVFDDIVTIADKCAAVQNYNVFLIFFMKHHKELNALLSATKTPDQCFLPHIVDIINGAVNMLRANVLMFEELISTMRILLASSRTLPEVLEGFLTLKPEQNKEALVAVRRNYESGVLKPNEALALTLKAITFDQAKQQLEKIQEECLFGLNFSSLSKQRLSSLNQIMGGLLNPYLKYLQPQLKLWNPTMSVSNKLKYIPTQFEIPQNSDVRSKSLNHMANFLCLVKSYPEESKNVFQSTLNYRYFLDLLAFLQERAGQLKDLLDSDQTGKYAVLAFNIYIHALSLKEGPTTEENAKYLQVFSSAPSKIPGSKSLESLLVSHVDPTKLKVKQYLNLLLNLSESVNSAEVITKLFAELDSLNDKVKLWRFHESKVQSLQSEKLTKSEADFITANLELQGQTLYAKTPQSVFKLTDHDFTTNPLSLDSRIDDYFGTLTHNSKRFIQILLLSLVEETNQVGVFESKTNPRIDLLRSLILELVRLYPVTVVYLCSLKLSLKTLKASLANSASFKHIQAVIPETLTAGEYFCYLNLLSSGKWVEVLKVLLSCRAVKYLNGKDFVKQELSANISQTCIQIINSLRSSTVPSCLSKTLEVLVFTLSIQTRFNRQQAELIKNLVQISKEYLSTSKDIEELLAVTASYEELIQLFFRLKDHEIKSGLESAYITHKFQPIRNFAPAKSAQANNPSYTKVDKLKSQVLLTYSVSLDFDIQEYVLTNIPNATNRSIKDQRNLCAEQVLKSVSVGKGKADTNISLALEEPGDITKEVDLSGCKFSILHQLGQTQISNLAKKAKVSFKLDAETKYPDQKQSNESIRNEEVRSLALFYIKELSFPQWDAAMLENALKLVLQGNQHIQFLRNEQNYARAVELFLLVLISTKIEGESEFLTYLRTVQNNPQVWTRILNIFCEYGYSNVWVHSFKELSSGRLPTSEILLKSNPSISQNESLLTLLLKYTLNKHYSKELNNSDKIASFLKVFFSQRPQENLAVSYKVVVDRTLLNLMLKCIDFKGLEYTSILFYSNFENLRLYTEDIQEGFKALNLASKTRSYNEFLKLSTQYNDPEFMDPLKLFKDNLKFFIKLEKQGYAFKQQEQAAIVTDKIAELIKIRLSTDSKLDDKALWGEVDKLIESYQAQINNLKTTTISRIKAVYLAARLRDLAIQNGLTITLLSGVLNSLNFDSTKLIEQIGKVQLLSLFLDMHFHLLHFENAFDNLSNYTHYHLLDNATLLDSIMFSTTRRFAFSLEKTHFSLDFDFDDLVQCAIVNAKEFLISPVGNQWAASALSAANPAIMTYNRINFQVPRTAFINSVAINLERQQTSIKTLALNSKSLLDDLRKGLLPLKGYTLLKQGDLTYTLDGAPSNLKQVTENLVSQLFGKQILTKSNSTYNFNRYKFSEDSLEALEILGRLVAAAISQGVKLNLPLDSHIVSQISGNMVEFDDLIGIDFKSWDYLKSVLSEQDSKTLNLNFSYQFEKEQRVELIEKGASKKVNNINRDEYCDLICCRILFGNKQQITRFLLGLHKVLPRSYLANVLPSQLHNTFYLGSPEIAQKLHHQNLVKFGVILPETYNHQGVKFQNLKDYVNIGWLLEAVSQLDQQKLQSLSQKLGQPNVAYLVIKVFTRSEASQSLELVNNSVLISHFTTKQALIAQLNAKI